MFQTDDSNTTTTDNNNNNTIIIANKNNNNSSSSDDGGDRMQREGVSTRPTQKQEQKEEPQQQHQQEPRDCSDCRICLIASGNVHGTPCDIKLGGVLCDLSPLNVAAVISALCGFMPAAVRVSGENPGRAFVWLRNPIVEAPRVIAAIHDRVWFGPNHAVALPPSPFFAAARSTADESAAAVSCRSDLEAVTILQKFTTALRSDGPSSMPVPRHLATAEYCVPTRLRKQ